MLVLVIFKYCEVTYKNVHTRVSYEKRFSLTLALLLCVSRRPKARDKKQRITGYLDSQLSSVLRPCSPFLFCVLLFVERAECRTLPGRGYQVLVRRSASVREHFGGLGSICKNTPTRCVTSCPRPYDLVNSLLNNKTIDILS